MAMQDPDIRWLQRFENYQKAVANLSEALELAGKHDISSLAKSGIIKYFELAHELAWKTVKDFFESVGEANIKGSLDALRLAFNRGLIPDEALIDAITSRNETVHMYDEAVVDKIFDEIVQRYVAAFKTLEANLLQEKQQRGL